MNDNGKIIVDSKIYSTLCLFFPPGLKFLEERVTGKDFGSKWM